MIVCLGCDVVKLVEMPSVTTAPGYFPLYCSVCQKTTNHRRLTDQDLRSVTTRHSSLATATEGSKGA